MFKAATVARSSELRRELTKLGFMNHFLFPINVACRVVYGSMIIEDNRRKLYFDYATRDNKMDEMMHL